MAEEGDPNRNPVEDQARQQTGQRQMQVRVSHQNMESAYANGFLPNATAEEVLLDFGLNIANPAGRQQDQPEMLFNVQQRVILSYYTAKRLAIGLSQLIRRHEEQFGEIELDVSKRRKGGEQ